MRTVDRSVNDVPNVIGHPFSGDLVGRGWELRTVAALLETIDTRSSPWS